MEVKLKKAAQHKFYQDEFGSVYCHFSFADYYDSNNLHFGPLRILNDCMFKSKFSDFGNTFQSHRDIEIITYVAEGELEYKDNKGNQETICPGDVFTISAGTGIISSIKLKTKTVKLIEVWVYPSKYSLKPTWAKRNYSLETLEDKLVPIAISEKSTTNDSALTIHQDTSVYLCRLLSDKEIEYKLYQDRRVYLYAVNGKISVNDDFLMSTRDAAKISLSVSEKIILRNNNADSTDLMLIDLPND